MNPTLDPFTNQPGGPFDTSLFFTLSFDLCCIAGLDGYFKKVNPAFIHLLGYSEEELLSAPFTAFIHPDDREATAHALLFHDLENHPFENRYRRKNGDYCWLSWSGRPKREEGLIYAVARDITEKKGYEGRLAKSESETKRILDSITDGFYAIDRMGTVTYINKASETFTGKLREEVVGRHIWDAFPEAVNTPFFPLYQEARHLSHPAHYDFFYQPLKEWVEVTVYPSAEGLSLFLRILTEKKKNEQKLKEAHDLYELITEATSSSVWEWEVGARTAFWHGKKMRELLGAPDPSAPQSYERWEQRVHPEDLPQVYQRYEEAIKNGEEYYVNEYRCLNKQEEYIYVRNRCHVLRNYQGDVIKIVGVMDDITAQKEAEHSSARTERDYKTLFNNAPLPQMILDLETLRILNVNEAAVKHYGYSLEEFLQMTIYDIRPAEDHLASTRLTEHLRQNPTPFRMTITHVKKDGERITVELNSTAVNYKGYNARLATINDITEKIRLQERVTQLRVQEQRKIAQATFTALENERDFIGKELHDNVNQMLTSTKLFLELALEREDIRLQLIETCTRTLVNAIQEIRLLSKSLTSPIIRDLGLISALTDALSPYILSRKFEVHFTARGKIKELQHDIQFALFRIVQEQLNNINKHADACNVWLDISTPNNHVEILIKDDGRGFDQLRNGDGIGLKNIRNRAEFLDGTAEIISAPGKGCTVKVRIPLQARTNGHPSLGE
ncbi:PAS domain S-box protein [Paraflavisolibacter sp. H34]|uniref:PAS domain-containing sensor histidine kinase n=1 Tax=Huijunlia imazamoxiresistens TaxID=3127457 RepID=UPI0030197007